MERKIYPFSLSAETSINLADDEDLLRLMVQAGFVSTFIGIETPHEASLTECNKKQNTHRDLVAAVKRIQKSGLEVTGGFIIGFDNDPPTIFETQINFIQKSGIVTAMVGLLNAPRGTRLYERLQKENRLLEESFTGDNMEFSLNYISKMNREILINGYKKVLRTLYSPPNYYERINTLLKEYQPKARIGRSQFKWSLVKGFFKCMWILGIREKGRYYYWKLITSTLFTRPEMFPQSIVLSVYGYHFRKVIDKYTGVPVK